MNYQISSATFDDPNMPDLLKTLANYFQKLGIDFYVVGAAARDIVLGMIHHKRARRKTNDLDIAIMIRDWDVFEQINASISSLPNFTKSTRQKQRFHYKGQLILDIIPFGEIARADKNIYWPPDETPVMSVSGFSEMAKQALIIILDGEFRIGVASLPGIFVLKWIAWHDRCRTTNKDADDIASIFNEYFEINLERIAQDHPDIFDDDNFTSFTAGAVLMGRDVRLLLSGNEELLHELTKMLEEQIDKAEDSLLISQILETHHTKKYEEVYRALQLVTNGIKK